MDEAEFLFTEILNCNRMSLFLDRESPLDKDKSALIASVLKRRIKGEPIQYILGKTEFLGLEFKVNKDVFIPRPETEILVEKTLEVVRKFLSSPVPELNILDMGTGSGCVAISLAKFLFNVKMTATDISDRALEVAKYNAKLNNVADIIKFIHCDLFTPLETIGGRQKDRVSLTGFTDYRLPITDYDIIISNPPYIPTGEIKELQQEIKYEPRIALDGGRDGLDFYRRIVAGAPNYLNKRGFLIMEMGFGQRASIENIFQKSEIFEIIKIVKDYNNIERVIIAKKISKNG